MQKDERRLTDAEKAYAQMARICSRRECAPFDIARKLDGMDLPEPVAEKIIDRLKKENYLDEERYIRSYIHEKLHFNQWGRKKITLLLKQKKLPQELIEAAFAALPATAPGELLQPLLEKKWESVQGKSDFEKRGKLIRYALGRGFTMDEIMVCLEKMQIGGIAGETT